MKIILSTLMIVVLGCSLLLGSCNDQKSTPIPEPESTPESTTEPTLIPQTEPTPETTPKPEPQPTPEPEPEPPLADPVRTDAGYISGTIYKGAGKDIHVYLGIPYAAPPVGDLRWKPPQPVTPWEGTRECITFGAQAPQPEFLSTAPCSEDCLYLNVMTPAEKSGEKLPVMVSFHGGHFYWGSSNIPAEKVKLLENSVIVVQVNSRIGILGLLAHPLLTKESPHYSSGNYMYLDLIASLQWVKKNIAAFGGDPDNVTIFGESGGGSKVMHLMASPLAKGLFHRAIIQSGSVPRDVYLQDRELIGVELFTRLGIKNEVDPLAAARKLGWEEIVAAATAMFWETPDIYGAPTVDGWFMPDIPDNIFKAGNHNTVPFITGAVLGEVNGRSTVLTFPDMIPCSVDLLSGAEKTGTNGYAYIFDQMPAALRERGVASCHALDLSYFNTSPDTLGEACVSLKLIPPEAKDEVFFAEEDWLVSDAMCKMWAAFARTGNPNIEGVVEWPVHKAATDKYLFIVWPLELKSGFSKITFEPVN